MAQWWKVHSHSTDPVEPPEKIELKPKTPQDLYTWAEMYFGYDADRVKGIMRAHDINAFRQSSWWTYVELIKTEWENDKSRKDFPGMCPICSATVQRDQSRDGLFGVRWGWKCTADRYHFMEERVNTLRTNKYASSLSQTE